MTITKTFRQTACFALTALACGSFAAAQNDECSTALPAPVGTTLFDTTAATLSPEVWPCAGGGGPDLWYTYTAPITAQTTISTCGGSSYDTALEVFTGACGALVPVACNDDNCGLQSSIQFAATMGTTYTFRVGGYMGNSGPGSFTIDDGRPQLDPVSGNYYLVVSAPGTGWDQARMDAEAMLFMGIQGRLATITSQQENDFIESLSNGGYLWLGGFQNLSSPSYSEPGGGWEWITGEPFTYTNWLPGEPNDTGGFASEDYLEMLPTAQFGPLWNDAHPQEHPQGYVVEFADGAIGTNYCVANPNSTGATGTISATGTVSIGADNFTAVASNLPPNQFGIFVTSLDQGFVPNAGGSSNGNICLGGVIGRFFMQSQIVSSGSTGEFSLRLPLGSFPQGNGFVAVMPGDNWNFQAWHRDNVGQGSNFTDGLSVTFL